MAIGQEQIVEAELAEELAEALAEVQAVVEVAAAQWRYGLGLLVAVVAGMVVALGIDYLMERHLPRKTRGRQLKSGSRLAG